MESAVDSVMRSAGWQLGTTQEGETLAKLALRLKAMSARPALGLPALWFLTDEERAADPLGAAALLPAGTGIVLRHYQDPHRPRLAGALSEIARERGLTLLIGADARLARKVKAHGVHLPRWSQRDRHTMRNDGWLICSAHGASELRRASMLGADAAFLGPVFATESHSGAPTLGALRFAAECRQSPLPVLALGGITAASARQLTASGAFGLGAIGALLPPTE